MLKTLWLFIKSLFGGLLFSLSGFAYVSSLKISSQPIAANCDISYAKLYPIGHLVGSLVGIIPLIVAGIFKLPLFVGKLTNIFSAEGNDFIRKDIVPVFIGNVGSIIGCGVAFHYIFKKTYLLPYVLQLAYELIELYNVWGYVRLCINGLSGGAIIYIGCLAFHIHWPSVRSFVIMILFTFLCLYNSFNVFSLDALYFAYAGWYSKKVLISGGCILGANVIGASLAGLMIRSVKIRIDTSNIGP